MKIKTLLLLFVISTPNLARDISYSSLTVDYLYFDFVDGTEISGSIELPYDFYFISKFTELADDNIFGTTSFTETFRTFGIGLGYYHELFERSDIYISSSYLKRKSSVEISPPRVNGEFVAIREDGFNITTGLRYYPFNNLELNPVFEYERFSLEEPVFNSKPIEEYKISFTLSYYPISWLSVGIGGEYSIEFDADGYFANLRIEF